MCEFIKPKKFTFDKEIGLSLKPQIEPLLSTTKGKRPENVHIYMMKYEFSKPYVPPVQPIKTEYQNVKEVKTDLVSDENVFAELGLDYDPLCFQLTYDADIRNGKERILERLNKLFLQGIIRTTFEIMD